MSLVWGVDSSHIQPDVVVNERGARRGWPTRAQGNYERATAADSLAGRQFTFYDWVVEQIGLEPRFWGRYINNVTADAMESARRARRVWRRRPRRERGDWEVASQRWLASRFATRVTESEIQFIHQRSRGRCKVLLVFNNIEERSCIERGEAGFQRGWADAFNAVFAARRVGAPGSVRIYGDIEGWAVSGEWLWGWCDYMDRSEYAGMGGLYGRGREVLVPAGRTYLQYERQHRRHMRRRLELPRPREQYAEVAAGRALAAAGPLQGPSRISTLRGLPAEQNPAERRRFSSFNRGLYFWTNMPRGECNWKLVAEGQFMGLGPSGARTEIWQYGPNCHGERLDLNVATQMGYADMWAGSGA